MEFLCEVWADGHDASAFDSGQPSLDEWLRASARDSDGRNLTRTYVWHRGHRGHRGDGVVVACCSLMPYVIERGTLGTRQGRGLPDRIPCFLIARLALDARLHGQRLGTRVLASALSRAASGSASLGGRFVIVDAIGDEAASFYRHHGFEPVPGVENRLLLPVKAVASYLKG